MGRLLFAAVTCLLLTAVPSTGSATVQLLINGEGLLTGAQNVQVGTGIFDVAFVDATCDAAFPGCAAVSPGAFLFTTPTDAERAAQALLDSVLVGSFDTTPTLTLGCTYVDGCGIQTPFAYYATNTNQYVQVATAYNYTADGDLVMTGIAFLDSTTDTNGAVWAVWSPHSTAVPEPSTLLLLASGLAGLGGVAWRRRKQ